MIVTLLWFAVCAAMLAIVGTVLTKSADTIVERTGMGRVFVGSLLLAGATTLPELSTGISAVMLGEPNLAAGNVFGANVANMVILAVLTLLTGGALLKRASPTHLYSGLLAIGLTLGAAALVLTGPLVTLLGVSLGSLLLALLFVVGIRMIYRHSTREALGRLAGATPSLDAGASGGRGPAGPAVVRFVAAAAGILLLAPVFASIAVQLAELSGLGATFVGTWLLGGTTTIPELVTGIAAVRLRAYDLAIANILGSNSFNMVVFLALDLANPTGSVFTDLSGAHAFTALGAVLLMMFALFAMYRRA